MGLVGPAETFSLLCRTVTAVSAKNTADGHNLPLLLLFKVITGQRNLAFPHAAADTLALTTYMTTTFQYAKLEDVTALLAGAFKVPATALDISARVTTRALYQLLTVLDAHLSSASPAHRCSSLNTFVSDNFQSSKHILNQPADVNAELVKKALNPDARQWSWLARNVALRSALPLGSPTTTVLCRKGLSTPTLQI
ncbi:hypothetical protein I4F81_004457 [Pyropia yezoensis]|uniref:Uncharacterized protein n=1 Tax=Pyropia yezoensis TaxID=2788 RepID=A0ACC3BVG4_PYRYE|nr:hypothetical protein I4F81_004457 [Neopyropia yezoensis]